jgi:membrane protein CcdC involved in cytochrome C biogenesis
MRWLTAVAIIIGVEFVYSIIMFVNIFATYSDKVYLKNICSLIYVIPSFLVIRYIYKHYKKQEEQIDHGNLP